MGVKCLPKNLIAGEIPFRSWIKDIEDLTGFSRTEYFTSNNRQAFVLRKWPRYLRGLPGSLMEWRGWEIDHYHFLLGGERKEALACDAKEWPCFPAGILSMSLSHVPSFTQSGELERSTGTDECTPTYVCTSEPSSSRLRFDVIYFLMFLKMKAKFIFSHISSPGSLEMTWRGTDCRNLPRLKWRSGKGPLLCPFSLRVLGGFEWLLKIASKSGSEVTRGAVERRQWLWERSVLTVTLPLSRDVGNERLWISSNLQSWILEYTAAEWQNWA